ncbi:ribosomal RNA-processing protein, putative [Entamoeba invadens IP1]|uniref:ribosomal RNA-processing protein, putative n=1 Tax=Entamoeba invadens IP1 TaxID=370355 RepID=UPI0002C3F5F2|nr:ribosomal RNA-processing protein, putative [Entamoeba invadens IP1]ELP90791.1 ribosomal RNA-processing protein, putative [Entamoeba invadens IP1]|eukprot:XP_004257562.1 ribosomal RNA-processing protein, putative [Entamoeba invadens IP1]
MKGRNSSSKSDPEIFHRKKDVRPKSKSKKTFTKREDSKSDTFRGRLHDEQKKTAHKFRDEKKPFKDSKSVHYHNEHPKSESDGFLDDRPKRSLLDTFQTELQGAKFRYINEVLYTSRSDQALHLFEDKPQLYSDYHTGYHEQVKKWPVNPLDLIIKKIQENADIKEVADMGCGDAILALKCNTIKVHSFDLVKTNERVTPCNIKKVPVKKGMCDAVVFCLSLMGIDFPHFIREGFRILKTGGLMFIAEVKGRFPKKNNFKEEMLKIGLEEVSNEDHNVFVIMTYRKATKSNIIKETVFQEFKKDIKLIPCLYKKR